MLRQQKYQQQIITTITLLFLFLFSTTAAAAVTKIETAETTKLKLTSNADNGNQC